MTDGESGVAWAGATAPAASDPLRPEPADVVRLGRRLVHLVVAAARTEDQKLQRLLFEHLGPEWPGLPVVTGTWAQYDHVNVQIGLDAWLAAPGRRHELVGVTGFRHTPFGLGDLAQPGGLNPHLRPLGVGSVAVVTMSAGPAGEARSCVQCGLYLADDRGVRLALLLREQGPISLEVVGGSQDHAEHVLEEVRRLAIEHNVYRGHVVAFGTEMFGPGGSPLSFLSRPQVDRGPGRGTRRRIRRPPAPDHGRAHERRPGPAARYPQPADPGSARRPPGAGRPSRPLTGDGWPARRRGVSMRR